MRKLNTPKNLLFTFAACFVIIAASCKKDNKSNTNTVVTPTVATPTKLGLYEADSSIFKLTFLGVAKIGTQTLDYDLIFDTGSGGMVIDANGILPASMITSTGFNFTGDSTVVDGITITNQTQTVEYGDDDATVTKVYGNLAYANVTIGDQGGSIVVTRLPFFIYYKGVDAKGNKLPAHEFDVMGVAPEYDITFNNGAYITSPLSYFVPGTGLTSGFKMAALGTSNFSLQGTFVPNVITLGLTAADLSSSSGFTMNQLTFYTGAGYLPVIPVTFNYPTNKTVSADVIFDTGTEPYSYIEDKTASSNLTLLPANSSVTATTTTGFTYTYTTTNSDNLTYIENPTTSGADVSILSLEFFLNNEYMLDYTNHKLGVKNN